MKQLFLISLFVFSIISTLFQYRVTNPLEQPYPTLNGYTLLELFDTFEDPEPLSIQVNGETIIYDDLDTDTLYSPLYNNYFYYLTSDQVDNQLQEFTDTPYYFMFSALNITLEKSIIDQYYFIYLDLSDNE